ncbi:proton-conducting transporter membrane subunit [Robiginitalea sp. M366]|uniref:proton-conducting transporter transmembrane domain-containing protein n=1 Tax=Robiginitalea aestuariiviva TaxID=3036903 RepID=UPI00240DB5C6|nr:proton-conducting transporter membrane subunit [Robiginitalea aestuariiviva]MDG1572465.1 proton-conducting transporter membrane subunit [Robiginitalea aestuariiviva]
MLKVFLSIASWMAPLMLYALAVAALWQYHRGRKLPRPAVALTSGLGILIAVGCSLLVGVLGSWETGLLGSAGLGLSLRLDPLSTTMFLMIALLGFIVLRFSANYLDGDPRKSVFMARLATTIASVELLVLSGNLLQLLVFWVVTSICLHYLLVFYRSRPQAIAAARKKFIAARLGDLSLLLAVALIYAETGTGNLSAIFRMVAEQPTLDPSMTWATALLVLTAALKSAQFPLHGWLIEVVETPTPVSALLHAGLLNAGPFLMVRLSFLMSASTTASLMLIGIGGFTALFASVVFLTQPSVKVALGYSSIAHMGFMLLICGFGVYTAAILHLVAHSFYKAHAFLSSGSVIDSVRARKVALPRRRGNLGRIGLSIGFALAIYACCCYLWGVHPEQDFTLMATGAIIVMGLSQIIAPTLDSAGTGRAVLLSSGMAFMVALAFFSLEQGAHALLHTQIPVSYVPNASIRTAVMVVVTAFALAVMAQLLAPRIRAGRWGYALGVHLRNGLYANVIFDRMIGSLRPERFGWANLRVREDSRAFGEYLDPAPQRPEPSKTLVNS